jgi:uncharacterized membrane protein
MVLEDLANNSLLVGIIIIVAVVFLTIVGVVYWLWMQKKRYSQFRCIVWERDGFGQLKMLFDDAGIFVDKKTNNKRFFMKRANVGLEPDNIPYLPSDTGVKYVFLLRTGLKNFTFIRPNIGPQGDVVLKVGEEDVNWAINAYERQKKIFQQSTFMQYLPFIALAFVSIIILIVFIYFFKDFGVLRDAAVALKEASANLAAAKAGTTVLPA